MDGWWNEIEGEILSRLERDGESTPSELGRHLGLSTGATMSLLAILASDGKVSIARVAVNPASRASAAPVETETVPAPAPVRRRRPPMPARSPHA
jgi:DNA-binding Lrp family transcriptional regulator